MAKEILFSSIFPIYFKSINGFVIFENLEAILMLCVFNYFYYSEMNDSRINIVQRVFGGDIIRYLSFCTDEFESMERLPDYDDSFFENLKNLRYVDDKARLLEDFLRCGYLSLIFVEQDISWDFFGNIKLSAQYLMACNALKRGASKISCEDVVVGFTSTFRLITEDMREFVNATFDEKLG